MLKIVEIIPILSVRRGAETFFVNFCKELKSRNDLSVDVILLYDDIDDSFTKEFNKHKINPYFCHKHKGIDLKASRILKSILNEIKPDIIHTHNCCLFTYFFAFGFRKKPWKYFHTCHSIPDVEATKLEHFLRKRYSRKGIITNVAITNSIGKDFENKYKITNVPVVLNGIPLIESSNKQKKYDLISVAAFDVVKNHDFLMDVISEISKIEKNIRLICLGSGPLYDVIKKKIDLLHLNSNVLLLGNVNNVYEYLEESKIFVLPSLKEGNPISLLEALNCGLPIVAFKVGGIPDVVRNEENGFLINLNDSRSFVESILRLLKDDKLYGTIAKNNKKLIKNYSIVQCVDNYLKLFGLENYENS